MRRRRMGVLGSGRVVPYLREVSCLISDGDQYIDTGIVPELNDDIYMKAAGWYSTPLSTGGQSGNNNITHWSAGPSWTSCFGNIQAVPPSGVFLIVKDAIVNFHLNKSLFTFNGQSVTVGATYVIDTDLHYFLFKNIWPESKGNCEVFMYSFSIAKRCNFIPVVALFDGVEEGCMYDKISKKLFRNQGTGAFTWIELSFTQSVGGGA